jgi:membrane fusion protein (multidrug efflux system)
MRFALRRVLARPAPFGGRAGAVVLLAGLLAGCDQDSAVPTAVAVPPAVTVAAAALKDVTASAGFVGRVEAIDRVDLRARVAGFLEKRLFGEGQEVEVGQLLFVIETAPYEAVVAQRRADVTRAEAEVVNTSLQLERARDLVKRNNIPQATVDERAAADAVARANVEQAKAALQAAEIDLDYTSVLAPVAGQIGVSNFSEGSYVGPDSGPLATIVSRDPIYVTFAVSQRDLLEVRRKAAARGEQAERVVVRLTLADGSTYPKPGKVNFIDVRVDPGTDTLTVRAEFPNPEGLLVDGQFVTVTVEGERGTPAIVIPQVALQADQAGVYVLVVGADKKVEVRRVETGPARSGEIVVTKGLQEGEQVIVQGLQKVRPGQIVEPSLAPAAVAG